MFGARRQCGGIDLGRGSDHHELPRWTSRRHASQEVGIHSLIDHAEEPDARARKRGLVRRFGRNASGPREV